MKRLFKLFIISTLALIFSSCVNSNKDDLSDLIQTPKQDNPIIEGTWEVVEVKGNSKSETSNAIKMGDKLYVNKNLVAINESYAFPPTFTSKYVKLSDYLKNRGIKLSLIHI